MGAYTFKVGDKVRITKIEGVGVNGLPLDFHIRFVVGDVGVVIDLDRTGLVRLKFGNDIQFSSGDNIELIATPEDHIARLAAVMVWWRQVCPLNSGDIFQVTTNSGVASYYSHKTTEGRLRKAGFATLISRVK